MGRINVPGRENMIGQGASVTRLRLLVVDPHGAREDRSWMSELAQRLPVDPTLMLDLDRAAVKLRTTHRSSFYAVCVIPNGCITSARLCAFSKELGGSAQNMLFVRGQVPDRVIAAGFRTADEAKPLAAALAGALGLLPVWEQTVLAH
jgi:hypothetical protein